MYECDNGCVWMYDCVCLHIQKPVLLFLFPMNNLFLPRFQQWKKFGDAEADGKGVNTSTTIVADEVFLTLSANREVSEDPVMHMHPLRFFELVRSVFGYFGWYMGRRVGQVMVCVCQTLPE